MRTSLPLLLLSLLGHRDNARAIMAICAHTTRPPAAPFDLAFATPPPVPQSPAHSYPGARWISRESSNRNGMPVPSGGASSRVMCPLALTRRRRGCDDMAEPPPTSSPLVRQRRKRKGATAPPAAVATKAAPIRSEPLSDVGSGSSRRRSRVSTQPVAGAAATSQKMERSPRKKGASRAAAAAAAAAVDIDTADSAFCLPSAMVEDLGRSAATPEEGVRVAPGGEAGVAKTASSSLPKPAAAAAAATTPAVTRRRARKYGSSSLRKTLDGKPAKQKWGAVSAKRAKALRTGGRAFYIVCDAESITCPELFEAIDILDEHGTRDAGVIYGDWKNNANWRSDIFNRSKASNFELVQREFLREGSNNPAEGDNLTADVVALARSDVFKKHEFCLVSADDALTDLAARLREEGTVVRGVGRRQAPEKFLKNCDAFMYVDPANRYELLDNEGLVISVALCIALAAAGQEKCDWVRMKTIVNSLHAWDLGLESPNYFGFSDYDQMVVAMDTYVTGIEDTSGEVVVKVPPKPRAGEVPRGLEEVATYLYRKWVDFTEDPRMNDILLACIPACLQALAVARGEMSLAVKRFQQDGVDSLGTSGLSME